MKKSLTKLTELQATLLLSAAVGLVFIILSSIGLFFGKPGWIIGTTLGSAAMVLNIYLVNISSSTLLKKSKPGLFLIGYFLRMIIFVGLFALLVVFQFILNINAFEYSFWGYIIGFAPSTLLSVLSQLKFNKEIKG